MGLAPNSRLACCIMLKDNCDGLEVKVMAHSPLNADLEKDVFVKRKERYFRE